MTLSRLLTAVEVAELLRRDPRWVLDAATSGELPSFKVGRAVRFDEQEIAEWLTANRRGERVRPSTHLKAVGGHQ